MSIAIPTRAEINAAAERLREHVRRTPTLEVRGRDLGLEIDSVILKLELLQHTGSFKPRGAFNRILATEVPAAGLIAASGGNHAQAVAHAGTRLGIPTEIFVPETIPAIKLARLRQYDAAVRLVGEHYDEAREASEVRAAETGALVVHAYDQPEVVAGAGTLARELLSQVADVDTVLVAVGGGGLMAGTVAWANGDFDVVTVEPERCPTLHAALAAGAPADVEVGGLASDSLGARRIGEIAFAAAQRGVRAAVLVTDSAIRDTQRLLWGRLRLVAEPGGATALAALLSGAYVPTGGERVVALVCGANTDPGSVQQDEELLGMGAESG